MRRRIKSETIAPEDIQRIAEDIYIYGYPLLLMDIMRRMHTAAAYPSFRNAPANQFGHGRFLPDHHDKHTHPDADCLHSSAWLNLSREPVVLSIPRTQRYHLLSCFSGWYEIFETFSPRNNQPGEQHLGFVGPHWTGRLPTGVKRIVAPTETVWIDGCFAVASVEDIQIVHAVQNQFRLTPLSEWSAGPSMPHSLPFRLDVDQKTTPQSQVARFGALEFYTRLSRLLERNPAQACDSAIVAEFARIGFFPGEDFDSEMSPPETIDAMYWAAPAALKKIIDAEKSALPGATMNNWMYHQHPGRFETRYLDRAVAALAGIPGTLAEDVVCFHTAVDHSAEALKGSNRYVIHFAPDLAPPVNGFWSITLYNSRQHLASNNIQRYVIGDRNRLRLNPDSSLSIYIQHEWPGANLDSNWLPSPKDSFNLALRMYWPKPDVFAGVWRPPAVVLRTEV